MLKKFVVNRIATDWITMTTFEELQSLKMKIISSTLGDCMHPQNINQYQGIRYVNGFFGMGIQDGKDNSMLTVEGWEADRVVREFNLKGCNVPRVDVQLTIKKPNDYDYAGTKAFLKDHVRYNPEVRGWDSSKGGSTIYIGSATSAKQVRLYEKGDDFECLRYEVQLRDAKAKSWAEHASVSGVDDANRRALTDSMQFISEGCVVDLFKKMINNKTVLHPIVKVQNDTNKRRWLKSSVKSMASYAKESESNMGFVLRLIESLYEEIGNVK